MIVAFIFETCVFCLKMSSTYGRKQKAAAMAACRWGNLNKVTVQDFQRQVGNRKCNDAETQTGKSIALPSPANFKGNSVSMVFLTAPNLPDIFAIKLCNPANIYV